MANLVIIVTGLAVGGFLAWSVVGDLRSGQLSINRFASPIIRARQPVLYWFAVGLSLALAAFFLVIALDATGKATGWWEFDL